MAVPGYSLAERDRRWALARKLMAAENVEALIAYGGHGCAGAAGFSPDAYFSNDLPGSVIIFCRGADPVQLVWPDLPTGAHLEAAGRSGQMWIGPPGIRAGADAAAVAGVLREHGMEHGPAGMLGPRIAVPWHPGTVDGCPLWQDLLTRLPHVSLKPVGRSFLFATVCLSREELAVVRYCAAAGGAAARAMAAAAAPGVSEAAVAAAGTAAAVRLGCPASVLMRSAPGFAGWGPPSWYYRPEPPRILEDGDVLLAQVATRFGMRETRHQATIAIGGPHPDIETAAVIARASYQAGLRAAQVGNTFGDLSEAMRMPLKQAGLQNTHPLTAMLSGPGPAGGFGGGLDQLPQARRRDQLSPMPGTGGDLPLAPGMCCALMPSAVIAGRVVSLGGTIVIGEDDPVELSPFTARMLRVPAARPPGARRHGGTS
jgi:Xaa-Pro aminopeptidase